MAGIGRATLLLKKAFVANSGGGDSSKRNNGSSDDSGKKSKWGDTNKRLAASVLVDKIKRGKNQGGTPEKSATPSQDATDENQSPTRNVLWNEEIEKLQIKEEDLKNIVDTSPPKEKERSPKTAKVIVKKMKPESELNKPKPKIVTVARPAPPDAPIKVPDYSGFAGPRYSQDGSVLPHSLLGTFSEFKKIALEKGDLLDVTVPGGELERETSVPTLKYEKKKRVHQPPSHANENKALHNWQMKMIERKKQQGYISKLLQKNPEDLAMNAADNYRKIQEERYILDRTIPLTDYGKGYRVGSEFWKQQERFGDDDTGIHMTLTQNEKGYPQPVTHVGIPKSIRDEKGWHWAPTHTAPVHYPWHKAPYLEKRKKELGKYIKELDPHKPEFDALEIIGTNQPQMKRPESEVEFVHEDRMSLDDLDDQDIDAEKEPGDQTNQNVFGPSLNFAGQPARWIGDGYSYQGQVGIEGRVTFETYSGDRVTSYLYIVNDGTTAVYYDWKKLPKDNPFDLVHQQVQRFYFNNSSGVILPGETMKFPFVFKSPNAGVFTEQWKFETRPVLCGGASLIVTLRGIALQEDKFQKEREQLERDLQQKQAEQIVRNILHNIINGIKIQDRPPSPVDAYITEEEIFSRNNPKLFYTHDAVQALKQLYAEINPEEKEDRIWDLSVEDLKDELMAMDDDDERKEDFLHQMNTHVSKMSYSPSNPIKKDLYKAGYELLLETVDNIVSESIAIRQVMGLPERESLDQIEDNHRIKGSKSKGNKTPSLDKKVSPAKDAKPAKGKDAGKADTKGKTTPGPPAKKGPSRGSATPGALQPESRDRTQTPTSAPQSPIPDSDPVLYRKYKEKLQAKAYYIVGDMLDKMENVFECILDSEDRPPLKL
ncbi:MYCBP-associated protein-like isoform X2 [Mytilus californianus]|uniref:MYCBP-associated protein-like isoform X2 n=1 Tax=Mytilus californianus TaxID=6549 RepID=UPI002245DCC7|nr:MYCBP-associated protein-like isoform X2 [Mytilus californianus]